MQSAPFDPISPIVQISKCYVNPELCVSVVSDSVAVVAENQVKGRHLKKNGIFWEFFPNVGPPHHPFLEPLVKKKRMIL